MNEMSQLACAMATLVFTAGMLITQQLYIESRAANAAMPAMRTARRVAPDSLMQRTDLRLTRWTPLSRQER
jgi:hypothetical protein